MNWTGLFSFSSALVNKSDWAPRVTRREIGLKMTDLFAAFILTGLTGAGWILWRFVGIKYQPFL